ncbi:hypothetical protein BDV97DRAFT_362800 [Delphinella strobiligena]|nr:hypothetical protein BDV97DRAFT_362800 [Delphinella strobiligena]
MSGGLIAGFGTRSRPPRIPPSYTSRQNQSYTHPPPNESAPPPPSYNHKRTPSEEKIYIKELKAWAAEKEKMFPGAYGEYGNVEIGDTEGSGPRIPFIRDTRHHYPSATEGVVRERDETDAGADGQSAYTGDATGMLTGTRRESVGEDENEAAKRSGSAPKESRIKRRVSSFIHRMGMNNEQNGK